MLAWLSVWSEVQTCIWPLAQLMLLPLTVTCFSKIQIGFIFLVPAHLGSPGQRAVKRVCVCVCFFEMMDESEWMTVSSSTGPLRCPRTKAIKRLCVCVYVRFWHCLHCMQSKVYEIVQCPFVCTSVCLSVPFAHCSNRFAAVGPASRGYQCFDTVGWAAGRASGF